MSFEILGLEGSIPEGTSVAWGAAALSDGAFVVNAVTRAKAPLSDVSRLREEGHLHVFDKPIRIEEHHALSNLIVLVVDEGSEFGAYFKPDLADNPGVVRQRKVRGRRSREYVFLNLSAFSRYGQLVADAVAEDVLDTREPSQALLRLALSLTPAEPILNALHAFHADRATRDARCRLARASLRSAEDNQRFELTYRALVSTETVAMEAVESYDLKYEHGATQGGGFDVDLVAALMTSVKRAGEVLFDVVKRDFAFIRSIPQFRLYQMAPGSANFKFVPSVDTRSRSERVARYISLFYLQETLKGSRPDLLEESPELAKAAKTILEPAPETELSHTTLSDRTTEPLTMLTVERAPVVRSRPFVTLAVVSGLTDDTNAELRLDSKFRFLVSTTDDGTGNAPIGAAEFGGTGYFLRKPYIVKLVRERGARGSEKFLLKELIPMQLGGRYEIDSFGSAVVDHAIAINRSLLVTREDDTIVLDDGESFSTPFEGTLEAADGFLSSWRAWLRRHELDAVPDVYLPAPVVRAEPTHIRILRALAALDGEADVKSIGVHIAQHEPIPLRPYRIQVAAHERQDLLETLEDSNRIKSTEDGVATLKIYEIAARKGAVDEIEAPVLVQNEDVEEHGAGA